MSERIAKTKALFMPNLLINGDFQVWQRGESISCKSGVKTYTADMWLFTSDNPTTVVSRYSDGGRLTFTTATNKQHVLRQFIELNKNSKGLFLNQKVTLTIKVRSTNACSFQIGVGNQRKTVSMVIGDNVISQSFTIVDDDMINGFLEVLAMNLTATSSFNISFYYVKLGYGTNFTPLVLNAFSDELIRCMRYYTVYDGLSIQAFQSWTSNLRDCLIISIPLATQMRVASTISVSDCSVLDTTSGAIIAFDRLSWSVHGIKNNVVSIRISFKDGTLWSAGTVYNILGIKVTIDGNTY